MAFNIDRWAQGGKPNHTIVALGDFVFFKPNNLLEDGDLVCFYDGDYTDVLEMDDPLIQAELTQLKKAS